MTVQELISELSQYHGSSRIILRIADDTDWGALETDSIEITEDNGEIYIQKTEFKTEFE